MIKNISELNKEAQEEIIESCNLVIDTFDDLAAKYETSPDHILNFLIQLHNFAATHLTEDGEMKEESKELFDKFDQDKIDKAQFN